MEDLIKNIEEKFNSELKTFEANPLKSGIKWLIIIYILRKIYSWIKD
jgi:hypothetical protein